MAKVSITGGAVNQVAIGKDIKQTSTIEAGEGLHRYLKEMKQSIASTGKLDEKSSEKLLAAVDELFDIRNQASQQDLIDKLNLIISQVPKAKDTLNSLITGTTSGVLTTGIVSAIKAVLGT